MAEQTAFRPAITALASGLFSWLADVLLFPIDTISTRLKGNKTKPAMGTLSFLKEALRRDGRTLYRGVTLTLPHSFIPTALYIYLYETLMYHASAAVDKLTSHKQAKLVFPFFMSCFAEGMAMIIELPFDTVRTRIQVRLPFPDEPARVPVPLGPDWFARDIPTGRTAAVLQIDKDLLRHQDSLHGYTVPGV